MSRYIKYLNENEEIIQKHGPDFGTRLKQEADDMAAEAVEGLQIPENHTVVWLNELPVYLNQETSTRVGEYINDEEVQSFVREKGFNDINKLIEVFYASPEKVFAEDGLLPVGSLIPNSNFELTDVQDKLLSIIRYYAAGKEENLYLRPDFYQDKQNSHEALHRAAYLTSTKPDILGIVVPQQDTEMLEALSTLKDIVHNSGSLPLGLLDFSKYPEGLLSALTTIADGLGESEDTKVILGEVKTSTIRPDYYKRLEGESDDEYEDRFHFLEASRKKVVESHLVYDLSHTTDALCRYLMAVRRFNDKQDGPQKGHWEKIRENAMEMKKLLEERVTVVGAMVDWHRLDANKEYLEEDELSHLSQPYHDVVHVDSDRLINAVKKRVQRRPRVWTMNRRAGKLIH